MSELTALLRGRQPAVRIDREALKSNWRTLAARAPFARTGAAVKADGYGLGAANVAPALVEAGCRDFFVAWVSEGLALRAVLPDADCRIFVLQGLSRDVAGPCRDAKLIPVLSTADDVALWAEAGGGAPAAVQLETGMNRLGLSERDAHAAGERAASGQLSLVLAMSHLACADEPPSTQNRKQLRRFRALASSFPGVPRSLANSAGIFLGPAFHFDLTRPGIALYGGERGLHSALLPVATLLASVLQVRTARRGEAAGYGATVRLERETRVATVGLGYGDGYLRSASGVTPLRGAAPAPEVFVGGHRVPVLGRVSMDLTLLDVTDLPDGSVRPGDTAEFFGPNVSLDEVAARAGTISYEFLTSIGPRVARVPI